MYLLEHLSDYSCKCDRKRKKTQLLSASFQGVKRLFNLAYFVATVANPDEKAGIKDNRKYFLSRGEIENYKVLTDGRNVYDQTINDLIKQYDEARKISTGQGDDYTTGCLLDLT